MRPSVEVVEGAAQLAARLGYRRAEDVVFDPRGCTVRCVPDRRVVMQSCDSEVVYRKVWRGRRAAFAEWDRLHDLSRLGVPTPTPVCLAVVGRNGAVVTRAVAGRPIASWLRDVAASASAIERARWFTFVCQRVAPTIRALHESGRVYRDLYWNHVFASGADADATVTWIDVERVFAPKWRRRRWWIKDFAGLLASLPDGVDCTTREALRFLRACGGDLDLAPAIAAKAGRIRARRPRYG
jgi:tRNA A-37 threonylcarbamoyl transferase component Bud32